MPSRNRQRAELEPTEPVAPKARAGMTRNDSALMTLVRAIVVNDATATARLLAASPALARAPLATGATRHAATAYYFEDIGHYLYAGDTALHAAAAAYRHDIVRELI